MSMAKHVYSAQVTGTVVDVDANNPVTIRTLAINNTVAAITYLQIFKLAATDVTLGATVADGVIGIPSSAGAIMTDLNWLVGGPALSIACTTTRTGSTGAAMDIFMTLGE